MHNGGIFIVTTPIDGEPATHANGTTIGFAMADPAEADAWHRAGVEHGGHRDRGSARIRAGSFGDLYLAYLRDPDGNKLCALHRMPKAA